MPKASNEFNDSSEVEETGWAFNSNEGECNSESVTEGPQHLMHSSVILFLNAILSWAVQFGLSDKCVSELLKILKQSPIFITSEAGLINVSGQIPKNMQQLLSVNLS